MQHTDTHTDAERRCETFLAELAGTDPDAAVDVLRLWLARATDRTLLDAVGAAIICHANALRAAQPATRR